MIVTGNSCSFGNYIFNFLARLGGGAPCLDTPCFPVLNDDCINALEVTPEEAVYGTTRYALWDLLRDEAPDCITPITAPGVWYMVTGTGNILTATTCNLFTGYDTKLNVYAGSCDALMCITGNDNNPYCSFSSLHSTASWYSQTGVVYRILVQGAYGQTGAFALTVREGLECPCDLSYTEMDMGDLPACNYPTVVGNPAHALTNVAWLGQGITGEPVPLILDADAADDGVVYHSLPWMPCQAQVVTVTVTAGPMYDFYATSCGGLLFVNGWMDGNLDGDFCDTLCTAHGVLSDEWIVQDAPVVPGEHVFTLINPGIVDAAHHDGIFRWRLTEVPVGREGFGLVDPFNCSSMSCGAVALSCVGEVEDYILEDALEPPRPFAVTLYHGTGGTLILRWMAPLTCDYLIYSTTNPNHDGSPPGPDWALEVTLEDVPAGPAQWADLDGQAVSYRNYIIVMSCP